MQQIQIDFQFGLETGQQIQEFIHTPKPSSSLIHTGHPLYNSIVSIEKGFKTLVNRQGKGNEFLGWLDLPEFSMDHCQEIMDKAQEFSKISEVLVCIGIGGSYLGTKAIYEMLKPQFQSHIDSHPSLIFAGQHLGEDYLNELLSFLDNKEYTLCVISKSGTTTEPAIAFRLLRKHMENKYGKKEAARRTVAITDAHKGALKTLSDKEGYTTYVVPDNVGGRYSVLCPVGLFPLAVAGVDIQGLLGGALHMQEKFLTEEIDWSTNLAAQYALFRHHLYVKHHKKIELLVNYDPRLQYLSEWWKQLYAESEGKENKGIFPCSANLTTDLHSIGQYIQEGERLFMETVLSLQSQKNILKIPTDQENLDGMNFVSDRRISYVNEKAEEGTCMAHSEEGHVPVCRILLPEVKEIFIGQLIYFFEFACGISGYALDINPFDQPGVEAYKRNMFKLLGK